MPKELKKLITKMSMYLIHAYTYPHALPPHDPPPLTYIHIFLIIHMHTGMFVG